MDTGNIEGVLRVMTLKSGWFPFSAHYDQDGLEKLLIKAGVLKETVAGLPVLPWLASHLEEETIRKSIHSTAAIEGNPLSEEQVGAILSAEDQSRQLAADEQEILNLKAAYAYCRELRPVTGPYLLKENAIRKIHFLLTDKVAHPYNAPGAYRNHKVQVGDAKHGGVYTPPKMLADINYLMRSLVSWANSPALLEEDPLVRAALVHFHLARIHPFSDGNGRTARLVEALCLQPHGLGSLPKMLSNYYYMHTDEYYWAFSQAERHPDHDVTSFVAFVLEAAVASLYDLKDRMIYSIRRHALRDFYAFMLRAKSLTQRQHDLLILLLETGARPALADLYRDQRLNILYRNVSERTAMRDLKKLMEQRLLVRDKDSHYTLNQTLLDRG